MRIHEKTVLKQYYEDAYLRCDANGGHENGVHHSIGERVLVAPVVRHGNNTIQIETHYGHARQIGQHSCEGHASTVPNLEKLSLNAFPTSRDLLMPQRPHDRSETIETEKNDGGEL